MSSVIKKLNFDQYPDNATTSVNEGFIVKTSVDDVAAVGGPANFQGVSCHICIFIPRLSGFCGRPVFWMGRLKVSQIVNWSGAAPVWDYNFDDSAAVSEFKLPFLGNSKVRSFTFKPRVFTNAIGGNSRFSSPCGLSWDMRSGTKKMSFILGGGVAQAHPGVYYFCSCRQTAKPLYANFGRPASIDWLLGDSQPTGFSPIEVYDECVAQPADLSTRMKQIFPDSWVTP